MTTRGIGLREETPRSPPRRLKVVATEQRSPNLRRITFAGELDGFPRDSDGSHIKLFFRREGQRELTLPRLGPAGVIWPPPELRPLARTYSVSKYDPSRAELSVDFALHGEEGPATRWATHARVGDELGLAGPGGPNPLLEPADFYLLTGDLTAVPAIGALLAMMPEDCRGHVLLEVQSADDVIDLPKPDGVVVEWMYRRPRAASKLEARVSALSFPAERTFGFLAGESSAVVAVRDHLLRARGVGRRMLYATPYWREQQSEEEYHEERHRIMDELQLERS